MRRLPLRAENRRFKSVLDRQQDRCFKREGLEGHRRLWTRQQDSIAGLLVLGGARGGPTQHEVLQVGNVGLSCDEATLGLVVKRQRCQYRDHDPPEDYFTRGGGGLQRRSWPGTGAGIPFERLGWFPGDALTSRGKDTVKAVTKRVMPADNCHIPP
eukprot:jgi/Botrbrau1/10235/Bobra.0362s0024.1